MPVDIDCPDCGETFELRKRPEKGISLQCPECDFSFRYKPAKSKSPAKKSTHSKGMPSWVPFAIGGGVLSALLIVGIAVALVFSQSKSKEQAVLPGKDVIEASRQNPNHFQGLPPRSGTQIPVNPQPLPQPEPKPEPQPLPVPPPRPRDPKLPNEMPVRIELPALPPVGERPVLVLDPGTHTSSVKDVRFFPDGKKFATFSMDKTIRIWDTATGLTTKLITMPNGPGAEGGLTTGAISPDGKWIATGGVTVGMGKHGILVYLIAVATCEVERTFVGHKDFITGMTFSPDSKLLVTSSADGTARVVNVSTGELVANLIGHKTTVITARFHPKLNRIATACKDGTARIWTAGLGGKNYTSVPITGHDGPMNDIAWHPEGTMLATGGVDGTIRTWTPAGKAIRTYEKQITSGNGGTGTVQAIRVAFSRDGKKVVYGGVAYMGHAVVLDLESGERVVDRAKEHSNTVMACATSPTEDLAITAGGDANDIHVWRLSDGSAVHKIVSGNKSIWAIAAGSKGELVWGSVNSGTALPPTRPVTTAFELDKLDFVKVPQLHIKAQMKLNGFSVSQPDFFTIQVARDGQPYYKFAIPNGVSERIYSASLVAGNGLLIGTSSQLVLIDLNQKQVVKNFVGHSGIVTAVAPTEQGLFITGSDDQTVRIWRMDREEPILSFFAVGREWIAWTPEGYYAASPAGERLMGWQMNNGPSKAGSFYPAIQFRRTLYQPAIIQNLVRAKGDTGLAMALAIRDTGRKIPAVNLAQVLPPTVSISLANMTGLDVKNDQEKLVIKADAKATRLNPVNNLILLVDGRPFREVEKQKVARPEKGEMSISWTVNLPPGKHTIHALADNGMSQGISAPISVLQAGEVRKPNLYVFAVGVNEYPGPLKLNFATTDARAISSTFQRKSTSIFEKIEVKTITDRQATKTEMLKGLDWLASKMTAQDVGIFYFSGHGGQDEDGQFFLVPVDVNLKQANVSCLLGDVVKTKLANMPGKLVAIFDACHSGSAADSMQSAGAGDLMRELVSDDCGIVVICSSMGDEYSLESSETKGGLFTHSLVEGLEGKADLNNDGFVYIHEATLYAMIRVQQLSRGTQNPTLGRPPYLQPFSLTKK